jgi:hypothetical protein
MPPSTDASVEASQQVAAKPVSTLTEAPAPIQGKQQQPWKEYLDESEINGQNDGESKGRDIYAVSEGLDDHTLAA